MAHALKHKNKDTTNHHRVNTSAKDLKHHYLVMYELLVIFSELFADMLYSEKNKGIDEEKEMLAFVAGVKFSLKILANISEQQFINAIEGDLPLTQNDKITILSKMGDVDSIISRYAISYKADN